MTNKCSDAGELLAKAEALQADVVSSRGEVNWQVRLELQRLLELAILQNVDLAVARHAEQKLWNSCYKNCIDICVKVSSRKNGADAVMFQMFLSAAVGFLTQFLCTLVQSYDCSRACASFKGDDTLGILRHGAPLSSRCKASPANLTYLVQFCLIHIGDVLRHQKRAFEAESYYLNAVRIDGDFGHSFNQLGILETMRGSGLSSLYFYTRALYVRVPFALASSNIDKFYSLIDVGSPPTVVNADNFLGVFFQLFAAVHTANTSLLNEELCVAVGEQLTRAIRNRKFTADNCVQMLVVTLGTFWKLWAQRKPLSGRGDGRTKLKDGMQQEETADEGEATGEEDGKNKDKEADAEASLSADDRRVQFIVLFFFQQLAMALFKAATHGHIEVVSSVLSVLVGWMEKHHALLARYDFFVPLRSPLLHHVCALLNHVQSKFEISSRKYEKYQRNAALPEDIHLKGFLPLKTVHDSLDFAAEPPIRDVHTVRFCRLCRLVDYGRFLVRRIDDPQVIAAESNAAADDDKQILSIQFSCPASSLDKEEAAAVVAGDRLKADASSCAASTSAGTAAEKDSGGKPSEAGKYSAGKRQTKVLPLITILERQKNGGDALTKASTVDSHDGLSGRSKASQGGGSKGDHFQHPPSFSSRSGGASSNAGTQDNKSRYELPPRFQAAKLKQALSSLQNVYDKRDSGGIAGGGGGGGGDKGQQPPVFSLASFPPLCSPKTPIGSWKPDVKTDVAGLKVSLYDTTKASSATVNSGAAGMNLQNFANVPVLNSASQLPLPFQQSNSLPFSYSVPVLGNLGGSRQRPPVFPVPPPFLPPFTAKAAAAAAVAAAGFPQPCSSSQPSMPPAPNRNSSVSNLKLNSTGGADIWSPNSLFISNTEDPYFKLWQPNAASLTVTGDVKSEENWLKDYQQQQTMLKQQNVSGEAGVMDAKLAPSYNGIPLPPPAPVEHFMTAPALLSQDANSAHPVASADFSKLSMLMSELAVQQPPGAAPLFELGQGPFSYSAASAAAAAVLRARQEAGHQEHSQQPPPQPPPQQQQPLQTTTNVGCPPGHFSLFGNSLNPWEFPKWSKDSAGAGDGGPAGSGAGR